MLVVGIWRRVVAGLIDTVCLSPVLLVAGWLAISVSGLSLDTARGFRPEILLELLLWGGAPFYGMLAVALALSLLYGFLFVSLTGSSPGLRVMRVRVITVYGARPEWWRVLLRCSGQIIGLALCGLGLLWIGFDREKRGLHDWLAGTYVIRNAIQNQAAEG